MPDKALEPSHTSDQSNPEQEGREPAEVLRAEMPADVVGEIKDGLRAHGFSSTKQGLQSVLLAFVRSPELQRVYHTLPLRLLHPDRAIALGLTPAEDR